MNLFFVASGVGGDLRSLRPSKSAPFEVLANLLTAWAGTVASLHKEVDRLRTLLTIYGGIAASALVGLFVKLLAK